jgi:hypothetical protein
MDHDVDVLEAGRGWWRARIASRGPRVRVAIGLGAAGALAAGAFAVVTVMQPPSAYTAILAATNATCSQSFRYTGTLNSTYVGDLGTPGETAALTGQFDVPRDIAEESYAGSLEKIFVGGYRYVSFGQSGAFGGKDWIGNRETPADFRTDILDSWLLGGVLNPCASEAWPGILRSASDLKFTGEVSGSGWTGTQYTFSAPKIGVLSVAIAVDKRGRLRYLRTTMPGSTQRTGTSTMTTPSEQSSMTFSDFGVPVSVTPPPASEVALV